MQVMGSVGTCRREGVTGLCGAKGHNVDGMLGV